MKKFIIVLILFLQRHNVSYSQVPDTEKESLYKYALEMFYDSKFDLTIENCNTILTKGMGDVDTYKLIAMAYRETGDYEKAVNSYITAIGQYQKQFGKKDPSLSFDKGKVLMCQKKFDQAFSELNEARRIFLQTGKENFIYLEEIGLASHYKDDNKSAIETFKNAIQYGSTSAYIDLLSSLFQSNNFIELKEYSDSLLNSVPEGFMTDSMFYNYISSLNDIAGNAITEATLEKINRAVSAYRTSNRLCFQGLYNDILYARAYTQAFLGNNTAAYNDYRFIAKSNTWLKTVRKKVDDLKIKLGLDRAPPVIILRNPQVDMDNIGKIVASKRKAQIYGQVTDSSGIELITVVVNDRVQPPITSTEIDGLFNIQLELNPGRNRIIISATDKNENSIDKPFFIDFVEKTQESQNSQDVSFVDGIPEINNAINYHAVLIAEKDYVDEGFKDLVSPVDDAIELKNILMSRYGFAEENVRLLDNAGRQSILDTLFKVCKSMTDADNLLIFYAGHGAEKKVNNAIVGGYIIPSDAKKGNRGSYISNEDLIEPVVGTQARHVLFIVDACFAGLMRSSSLDDAPQPIKNLYSNKSRRILTSGNREEVPDQGQFITNVKNFLNNNTGMFVTAIDLYNFIVNNNPTNNSPVYERILNTSDAGGGQFIFKKAQ